MFTTKQISKNLVRIAFDKVVDMTTGNIINLYGDNIDKVLVFDKTTLLNISNNIQVVKAVDKLDFGLGLKTSDGPIESSRGFLIQVFSSGSNGTLTRLYSKDTIDPINKDKLLEGFTNYFDIEVY